MTKHSPKKSPMEIKPMMNKKILSATLLLSLTNVAHAGFFDSLFTSKEETPAITVEPPTTKKIEAETSNSLLNTLTQQLGVTDTQAQGGLGSLMKMAQGSLSSNDFGQLSSSVPNMDSLLAAVPALTANKSTSGISDILSKTGGIASSLAGLSLLTEQFEALGLSSEMITKFSNIAISYFSKGENVSTADLLQKGLSSIMG